MDAEKALIVALLIETQEQLQVVADCSLALIRQYKENRKRRHHSVWVREWLTPMERQDHCQYYHLVQTLRQENPQQFKNYMRMPVELFDEILLRVQHHIVGKGTNYRPSLEAGLKLSLTLRHLATGDQYPSMAYGYRVSRKTIQPMIPKVCQAIIDAYRDEVFKTPTTEEEWKDIAKQFEERWQIPHAIGALDGKHVRIRAPPNSGSDYWCVYKGCYSIVLLALVDHDYKFIWVDTGGLGHQSDAQIFNESNLKQRLEDGTLGIPPSQPIEPDDPESDDEPRKLPYFILGDDAFALRTFLMKPISKRNMTKQELIYNYRISRGRRVVENAFGILANRWRCLLTTLHQSPGVVQTITECCIVLHNLLRLRFPVIQDAEVDHDDDTHELVLGSWRHNNVTLDEGPACSAPRNRDHKAAKDQRQYLQDYFNDPTRGAVDWQDRMVTLRRPTVPEDQN